MLPPGGLIPLAELTTLGVGGPAELVAPRSLDALAALLRRLWREGRAWRALGRGSNLIVCDRGVREVVVHTRALRGVRCEPGGRVVAAAGTPTAVLLAATRRHGLGGLECLVGYPATIGGAVRMNAGGKWGTVSARVRSVRSVDVHGEVAEHGAEACAFGYRSSAFADRLVAEVELELPVVDPDAQRAVVEAIHREKAASQPLTERSAGCIFKNPPRDSAGRLIDACGLKGLAVGGAAVSTVHGNFIVNRGGASADDVLRLIERVQGTVAERAEIDLELEVEVWRSGRVPAAL